jgi:hypothetical protein
MKIRINIDDIQISPREGNLFFNGVVVDVEGDHRDHPHRGATSVFFAVPQFVTQTGEYVPMAIKIATDAIVAVPLVFKDQAGHNLAGHTTNVRAEVEDPSLATAEITSDGQWVQITPLKTSGASKVTYWDDDDNISTQQPLEFSIVQPNPSGVEFNEGGAVFSANPNPPTDGAAGGTPPGGTPTGQTAAYQRAPAGVSPNPATGRNVNPTSGLDINPATGLDIDSNTGQDIPAGSTGTQPGTPPGTPPGTQPAGTPPAPGTQGTTAYAMSPVGVTPNPATGRNVNPVSGLDINPQTGLDIDANTGQDVPAQQTASRRRQP